MVVKIFAEVSTSTFAHKEAGAITFFDAMEHYGPTPIGKGPTKWARFCTWCRNLKHWRTGRAVRHLMRVMAEDRDYAWSWHCNLAMPMSDAGVPIQKANEIAERLMRHIFGVKDSASIH